MYAYLTMVSGNRPGTVYMLEPTGENLIGRGLECKVVLTDPLSSRVHAVVEKRDGDWWVRDGNSRNGTFVNGQKIDEAALADNHTLRVGGTEFSFHHTDQPPTVEGTVEGSDGETIIKDVQLSKAGSDTSYAVAAIRESEQAHDLLLLYQLSIKLLGCASGSAVVPVALELLRDRTEASVVGFLWINDEGQLVPKLVIPEEAADEVQLSQSLTHLVSREGRAVWIANQRSSKSDEPKSYADAICVPLLRDTQVIGAIHVYRSTGRFRQSHFDFAISVANITGVALVRARQEESLQTEFQRLKEQSPGFDELVGESPPMQELKGRIQRLGPAGGCVLVRGESGTGKELVARALHRHSPRADRPLVSVNCAAIPGSLMESQLFGHKAGSFTGADADHAGYFQQADLGTLFLDEIGELPLEGQAKLLRILEGHPFLPVGATKEVKVDVRVIAATNQDLQTYVREKKFREDLYYRLSVFELNLPPLRERGSDLELLIDFFLDHFRRQHGRPQLRLSEEAREKLLGYQWPGNVRQLRNVLDSAVVLAGGDEIQRGDLALRDSGSTEMETLRLDHWERKLIIEALKRTSGSVPEAAKLLGIARATLYRKIDEYGVER